MKCMTVTKCFWNAETKKSVQSQTSQEFVVVFLAVPACALLSEERVEEGQSLSREFSDAASVAEHRRCSHTVGSYTGLALLPTPQK